MRPKQKCWDAHYQNRWCILLQGGLLPDTMGTSIHVVTFMTVIIRILNTTIIARACHQTCSPEMWPMYRDGQIKRFSKHVVAVVWMPTQLQLAGFDHMPKMQLAFSLHRFTIVCLLLLLHMENCSIELISLAQAIAVCIESTLLWSHTNSLVSFRTNKENSFRVYHIHNNHAAIW